MECMPAGENRASVLTVFENTHFFPSHAHLTLRHWVGGGGDVNVHVNLHHMYIVRYVTGLGGWGC